MIEFVRAAIRRHDLLTYAGLACGVVPLAIIVHLSAEIAASGIEPGRDLLLRHAYMLPLLAGALTAFASTLGIGRGRAECIRRCAFVRAAVRRLGRGAGVRNLFLANLAFFGATQTLEGVPIAVGSLAAGLAVAAAGSLIAAFIVFALGRTLVVAIELACALRRCSPSRRAQRKGRISAPRRAGRAFSLFIPNRPPPSRSLA